MKFLKGLLLTLAGIVILALIVALFIKKDYAVEREVTINKPKSEVFEYIKYVKNQDNYSVWNKLDPGSKRTYKGTDGTVGYIYAWDSNKKEVGKGEQEITNIVDGERIDMQLRFIKPFEAKDNAYMTTEDAANGQTKVKWGFKGKMAYPMNLMLLFIDMEQMLGTSLQDGLNSLKTILESE